MKKKKYDIDADCRIVCPHAHEEKHLKMGMAKPLNLSEIVKRRLLKW